MDDLEQTVSDFYQELVSKQEPLGQDFQEVIMKNLWNLYDENKIQMENI